MPVSKKSKRQKARHQFLNEGGTPTRETKFLRSLSLRDKKNRKAKSLALKKARKQKQQRQMALRQKHQERGVL